MVQNGPKRLKKLCVRRTASATPGLLGCYRVSQKNALLTKVQLDQNLQIFESKWPMGQMLVLPNVTTPIPIPNNTQKSPYFSWFGTENYMINPTIFHINNNQPYQSINRPSTNCSPYVPRITLFSPEIVNFRPKNALRFGHQLLLACVLACPSPWKRLLDFIIY